MYFIFNEKFYKTNGTTAGTVLIRNNFYNAKYPFSYNGKVYLIGADNNNGTELWQSDGTAAGTIMLKNINIGSVNNPGSGFTLSFDPHFTLFNNIGIGV